MVPSGTSQWAEVSPTTTQFNWQDSSLSTENRRQEKIYLLLFARAPAEPVTQSFARDGTSLGRA